MNMNKNLAWICVACLVLTITEIAESGDKPEIFVQMGHTKSLTCALFSPDGKYLLSGSTDNTIKVWEIASGKEFRTLNGPTRRITSMAISPDGRYVVSGDEEYRNNLKLWNLSTGQIEKTFGGHPEIEGTTCVAFSPDGKYILSGGDTTVKLWDIASGKEIRRFIGNTSGIRAIVVSPDGRYVVCGSRDNIVTTVDSLNPDGTVYESQQVRAKSAGNAITAWEIATGRIIRQFNHARGWVETLAMSPDGKFILSGDFEDRVRMWDVASGREIKSFETEGTSSIAISPDGKYALFGSVEEISLWNIAAGAEVKRIAGLEGWVRTVAFSPDAGYTRALTADDSKSPGLWDLASGKALAHFGGITQRVSAVVVSPDGKKLLVGQDYGYINVWDIASGRQAKTIKTTLGIESIAIDGKSFTVGAGGWDFPAHASTAKFWDLATGKELCTTTNDGSSWVKTMTIRPDLKRHLWTAGGNLFLSDATTGAIL
ncbi:MAG TPA: WD40 repeat domain-containing protein, partial [Bacteroidota bacterium]